MDPFTLEIVGAVLRWALTGLGMWLVQHHVINETQASSLAERAGTHLLLVLPLVAPLLWSLWAKVRARVKLNTAMAMGPTNEVAVKARISNGAGAGVATVMLVLALAGGALVSSACAPTTWKNPQTVQVFNRDGLVKSMAALQHTAILLGESTPPRIPLRDTKIVVDAVQTFLDAADHAGEGAWGTAAAILDSLTKGNPAAGIPAKLPQATVDVLLPWLDPITSELRARANAPGGGQ